MQPITNNSWPISLYRKSVLKQRKFKEIERLLGETNGLHCLDLGADNGALSYLFRQRGGSWKSADLDEVSVTSILQMVKSDVYQVSEELSPFVDNEFDCVVVADFLEHLEDDERFVAELYRVVRPGGTIIVNTPNHKESWLRRFRLAIGQTDEKHGHVRPGYTLTSLEALLDGRFSIVDAKTYSRFFAELIDTLIVQAVYLLKNHKAEESSKGAIVSGNDLDNNRALIWVYSLIYPFVRLFASLDRLLFFTTGYMLIAKASVNKEPID